jgi:hypothetical protein
MLMIKSYIKLKISIFIYYRPIVATPFNLRIVRVEGCRGPSAQSCKGLMGAIQDKALSAQGT